MDQNGANWPLFYQNGRSVKSDGPFPLNGEMRFGRREGSECCQEDVPKAPEKISTEVLEVLAPSRKAKSHQEIKETEHITKHINYRHFKSRESASRRCQSSKNVAGRVQRSYPSSPPSTSRDCRFPFLLSASALDDVLTFGPFQILK